ncbi:unnamed protein product [Sympodiomycopsis kandeliae]
MTLAKTLNQLAKDQNLPTATRDRVASINSMKAKFLDLCKGRKRAKKGDLQKAVKEAVKRRGLSVHELAKAKEMVQGEAFSTPR